MAGLQNYIQRGTQWKAVGRNSIVAGFPAFTPLDVYNKVILPTGSLDAGPANVGCRIPRGQLTVVNSEPFTITDGATYTGLDIRGRVTSSNSAHKATFVDCYIEPAWTTLPTAQYSTVIGKNYDFGGTEFHYCTIDSTTKRSAWLNTMGGGNWKAFFCDILGGVDGVHTDLTGKITLSCCRLYGGDYWAWWDVTNNVRRTADFNDAVGVHWAIGTVNDGHSDGNTHSDGLQLIRGPGIVVQGNYIGGARTDTRSNVHVDPTIHGAPTGTPLGYDFIQSVIADQEFRNAAVIFNPQGDVQVVCDFSYNVLHGGAARANIGSTTGDTLSGLNFHHNLFVRSSYGFYIYKSVSTTATIDTATCLYYDTLTTVPVNTF